MKEYLAYTRSPWFSYVAVLPLLVLYQLVVFLANFGHHGVVMNGADAIVRSALGSVGLTGWLGSWIVLAAVVGVIVFRRDPAHSGKPLRTGYFPVLLAESTVYALFFGTAVATVVSLVLPGPFRLQIGGGLTWGQQLASSLGAGLYEELVFRLILTGGLLWAFRQSKLKEGAALAAAICTASFIFSLFHYVGSLADVFTLTSFTFRFVAGVMLTALYAVRGFAVAAWTHALYDVFLLIAKPG